MGKKLCTLTLIGFILLAALSACTGCSGKKEKPRGEAVESPINPMVEELDETPDEAFLATLTAVGKDSLQVTAEDRQHTRLTLAYQDALTDQMVYGTLHKGDTFSIMLTGKKSKEIAIAINTTELSGRWFYNEQQHRGLSFNKGGGMGSINSDDICFREWKLLNGKMYVYYVDLQQVASDRHQYLVEEAHIAKLNSKALVLHFRGQTYNCKRPSDKPLVFKMGK